MVKPISFIAPLGTGLGKWMSKSNDKNDVFPYQDNDDNVDDTRIRRCCGNNTKVLRHEVTQKACDEFLLPGA